MWPESFSSEIPDYTQMKTYNEVSGIILDKPIKEVTGAWWDYIWKIHIMYYGKLG